MNPSSNHIQRYTLHEGDIIIRNASTWHNATLVGDGINNALLGGNLSRVRVDNSHLRPEFLMGWLQLFNQSNAPVITTEKVTINNMYVPVPPILEQERFSQYFYRACTFQDKLLQTAELANEAFRSLLTYAFTARLSADYRRRNRLSDPDYNLVFKYYHAFDKEIYSAQQASGDVRWETVLGEDKAKFIASLSKFQQSVLAEYYLSREPLAAHTLLKKLKLKPHGIKFDTYNVQDAIAIVRILEGFGLIERLPPQKIAMDSANTTFLEDHKSQFITIIKHQFTDISPPTMPGKGAEEIL